MHLQARARGYKLISYVSSRATVFPDTESATTASSFEDTAIQPFTAIASSTVLWSCSVGHYSRVGDHAALVPHVAVAGHCDSDAYIYAGNNSSIHDGIHLAEGTFVGMGAAVTRNTVAPVRKSGD